jgi:hypothetical protein
VPEPGWPLTRRLQVTRAPFAQHRSMHEVETGVCTGCASHGVGGPGNEAPRERVAVMAEAPKCGGARVSSDAVDDGDRLLLFGPLAVPSEIEELAAGRELVVVLTSAVARARVAS